MDLMALAVHCAKKCGHSSSGLHMDGEDTAATTTHLYIGEIGPISNRPYRETNFSFGKKQKKSEAEVDSQKFLSGHFVTGSWRELYP